MEIAYLSEFLDCRSDFRCLDAPGQEHVIKAGDSQCLEDVYCNHILEGGLPEMIPDTAAEPIAAALPITKDRSDRVAYESSDKPCPWSSQRSVLLPQPDAE